MIIQSYNAINIGYISLLFPDLYVTTQELSAFVVFKDVNTAISII